MAYVGVRVEPPVRPGRVVEGLCVRRGLYSDVLHLACESGLIVDDCREAEGVTALLAPRQEWLVS